MDYFAHASEGNTKLELPSLGSVELKYISGGDSIEFVKILDEDAPAKAQVQKILHHQLVKPLMSLEEFQKLPAPELEALMDAFVHNEEFSFKHFKATGSPYQDFVAALNKSHQEEAEQVRKTFQPMLESAQKNLLAFNTRYESVLGTALKSASAVGSALAGLNSASASIGKALAATKPAIEQYSRFAQAVSTTLAPQIDVWQKWAAQNQQLFASTGKVLAKIKADFDIAEKDAVKLLRKYKWFISPNIPVPIVFKVQKLDKKKGRQDKAVNALFISYFEANDWQHLEAMASTWQSSPFFESRYKIIVDCVRTVKTGSKEGINVSNVVLPTLIIQIDGILNDYMQAKGLTFNGYNDRNTVLKANRLPVTLPADLDDLANEIFLNILFQRSYPGVPLSTPYNFNRHKILHAENKAYGRKDYMIRAFMVLDLLSTLR